MAFIFSKSLMIVVYLVKGFEYGNDLYNLRFISKAKNIEKRIHKEMRYKKRE